MAAPASFSRINGFIDRIGAIETPFSIEMPDGNKRYVWRRRRPRADPPQSGHRQCSHSHCSGRSRIQPSMIALTRDMVAYVSSSAVPRAGVSSAAAAVDVNGAHRCPEAEEPDRGMRVGQPARVT